MCYCWREYQLTAHSDCRRTAQKVSQSIAGDIREAHSVIYRMAHPVVEPPKYISASRVKEVLKYEDLIPVIEEALVNFSARESGGVVQPVRTALQIEDRG